MTTESARALVSVVLHAVAHRRGCLQMPIGDLPEELLAAAFEKLEKEGQPTSAVRERLANYGVEVRPLSPIKYTRRNNNQIDKELELVIEDLLKRNWKKARIARTLRLNRRTRRLAECTAMCRDEPVDIGLQIGAHSETNTATLTRCARLV